MFNNNYKNKKVIITGNTGFKGSWLSCWLIKLGAKVVGISNSIPTKPSLFEDLNLEEKIKYYNLDIRDLDSLKKVFIDEKPDFVFHLAAQAIVSVSYEKPIETITSNVIGTANVLESLRVIKNECCAILITSDKAYDNVEQVWGYKEDDKMGGKDIYSGSKGAAELIIKSYFNSFLKENHKNIRIGIGRAGNVIGGGDWAKDRIIVDCFKAWSKNNVLEIRSPKSTRPWQHVLEPLSGYLDLGGNLFNSPKLNGFSFNFGPNQSDTKNVEELINDLAKFWNFKKTDRLYKITSNSLFFESTLLKLNCDKALFYLDWKATLTYLQTVELTGTWYNEYFSNNDNLYDFTLTQIEKYFEIAKTNKIKWTEYY